MKAQTLRNAIEAHGWVGAIISVPLFIVFWAGAITLFFPEVSLWSQLPLVPAESTAATSPSLRSIVDQKLADLPRDETKRIYLDLPDEHSPFLRMHVPLKHTEDGAEDTELIVDPARGDTLAAGQTFELASFLYALHYNFNLPQGSYIVGVVTLFFLVIMLTGVVIQLKNLLADFFLYRHERGKRQRLNDIHTVSGVVTLPFAILYALTGLMFNLSLLFYLPVKQFLYHGEEAAMMKDAGFSRFTNERAGVPLAMPELEPLIDRVAREQAAQVTGLSLIQYGDQNAMLRFRGTKGSGFPERLDRFYEVASDTFPEDINGAIGTAFSAGVNPLFRLHMGTFGGPGVRFLFFVLALGVCGMIVAGNLLWLAKREAKRAKFARSFAAMRGLTLGGCVGVVLATCLALVLERTLPPDFAARADVVQWAFAGALLATTVSAFYIDRVKPFLVWTAWASAGLLVALAAIDVIGYGPQLVRMWNEGYRGPAGVTLALCGHALLFAWIAGSIRRTQPSPIGSVVSTQRASVEAA